MPIPGRDVKEIYYDLITASMPLNIFFRNHVLAGLCEL